MKISTVWLFALVLSSFSILSTAHWWFMSEVFALGAKIMCNHDIAGLVNFQRQLCRENPDVMVSIGKGAKLGVEECQYQLKDQRWNCSTVQQDVSVFGKVMKKASRESAFVYAITSAGVVHEVTRGCSRGELKACACDTNYKGTSEKGFEWGGCSDNIAYGLRIAKLFVDSGEKERDARAKMNLHNNLAGRRAVRSHTILNCMCHGVSGACLVKTCWITMASFSTVGSYLREKYHNGVLVTVDQKGNELVVADGKYLSRPARDDLVFLEESPDYCVFNSNTGSLGTTGRICLNLNKTASFHGTCGILCCNRGFNTIQIEEEYKCRCKLDWCCDVKCKTCKRTVEKHVCKSPFEEYMSASNNTFSEMFVKTIDSYDQNRPRSKSGKKAKKIKKRSKNKKRSKLGDDLKEED
ncbi:hypothetical protein ACROYT_G019687 [Oculina patagonica]